MAVVLTITFIARRPASCRIATAACGPVARQQRCGHTQLRHGANHGRKMFCGPKEMLHPQPDNGVVFSLDRFADPVQQVTDERIIPMSTHRWMPCAFMQAQTGSLKESPDRPRADPLSQAAFGILILAFTLGAFGADAASSGHGNVGHASGHQPESSFHLAASADQISSGPTVRFPWMF